VFGLWAGGHRLDTLLRRVVVKTGCGRPPHRYLIDCGNTEDVYARLKQTHRPRQVGEPTSPSVEQESQEIEITGGGEMNQRAYYSR